MIYQAVTSFVPFFFFTAPSAPVQDLQFGKQMTSTQDASLRDVLILWQVCRYGYSHLCHLVCSLHLPLTLFSFFINHFYVLSWIVCLLSVIEDICTNIEAFFFFCMLYLLYSYFWHIAYYFLKKKRLLEYGTPFMRGGGATHLKKWYRYIQRSRHPFHASSAVL